MEQQTMTGSGLYILIAVQLLFSMLILLRIRQYRKSRQAACRPFSSSSPQQASPLCLKEAEQEIRQKWEESPKATSGKKNNPCPIRMKPKMLLPTAAVKP